jgi:hypothetical protein
MQYRVARYQFDDTSEQLLILDETGLLVREYGRVAPTWPWYVVDRNAQQTFIG